ncbi:MAG TPA: hypothetical protein VLR71_17160 [Casimicrobiaceae bacterium]|nr:hypothetical protein [Casimicrobiaceae bacterium]
MRKPLLLSTLTLAAMLAMPAAAQTAETSVMRQPGKVGVARTMSVTATITAVDTASREVTLKGPQGNELQVVAGPEVKNFAQLKAGDKVQVQYVEAVTVELKKGGTLAVARTEKSGVESAAPGARPGAIGGRRVTVVGDVVAVDAPTQTITVRGPQRTVELSIDDPEQFKRIAKGDQIEAQYIEAAAVAIVPEK